MTSACFNFRLPAVLFAALVLSLAACRKNADDVVALLSDSEAAELAEAAVSERTAGATMPAVDLAALISNASLECDVPGDTTLQKSNSVAAASYSYTFELGWLVDCNDAGLPLSVSAQVAGNGTFSTANWSGADQTTGNLNFTGLSPAATEYTVAGSYTLHGDLTGNLRRIDPTLDVQTTVQLNALTIRKSDYQITGGTGTLVITATNGQGRTETLDGTLVFNGNGTVTVTVNGHTHTFG